ncbi:hypothetical protein GCM10023149_06610 [Mucilaginibacter gynuensis]|uniref:Trypsin-like peptidase n=1 Tax=Mucilaginibacter gynuensis TaxID=1302236 RepID=A0ABP8FV23_9SPHI
MSDTKMLEQIERYLNGEMSLEERAQFEQLRKENAVIDSQVVEHQAFVGLLKHYGERLDLETRLNAIHDEIDVNTLKEELMVHPSWIVSMWRHHHSKISVAASIAIFAMLSTLFFTGKFNNKDSKYLELRDKIGSLQTSTARINATNNRILNNINKSDKPKPVINPGNFRGTGFALTSNGYIVTNYHVIKGADSLYVQNVNGDSYHAKVVYSEPEHDIAVLEINDSEFKNLGAVPYNFKKSKSDLGEDVYTIGYPSDAIAFGPGFLTSAAGFNGDTTAYEVSIAARPGNSGGPLLDSKGNLIGIISGKQTQYESSAYAIKSNYLLKAIQDIPSDSLKRKLSLNTKNKTKSSLAGLSRTQQLAKLQKYIFMVKVY